MEGSQIFQVVGYQNSGKTTLMENMIEYGSEQGMMIGTIKHHGHGGEPERNFRQKDSDKHRAAGAIVTAVEGDGIVHIEACQNTLQKTINMYQGLQLDLILVEGYKRETYPKVVLIRNENDLHLLSELTNIKAVMSSVPLKLNLNAHVFFIDETEKFLVRFFNDIYMELS